MIYKCGLVRDVVDRWIAWDDTFHSLIDMPTRRLVIVVLLVYLLFNLSAALIFWSLSKSCKLDIQDFNSAFLFSIETTMTIGYGLRSDDPYMDGCEGFPAVLFFVMVASTALDACLLGLLYGRLSRADKRGRSICFSNKAIIRRINNIPYFMFQLCEMRSHQLVEAHVGRKMKKKKKNKSVLD
eukprot:jgi/Bigna1/127495/aug1.4_g2203